VTGKTNCHLEHDVLHQRQVHLDHRGKLGRHRIGPLRGSNPPPSGSSTPHSQFHFALVHRLISITAIGEISPQHSSNREGSDRTGNDL
jgi:hypothetical protein